MVNCCVPGCNSHHRKAVKGISYHEFPSVQDIRTRWIKSVSRDDWFPNDNARVCSKHFRQEDYIPGLKIKKLKKDAVPTVFETYPSYLQLAAGKNAKVRKPPLQRQPPTKKLKTTHEPSFEPTSPMINEESTPSTSCTEAIVCHDNLSYEQGSLSQNGLPNLAVAVESMINQNLGSSENDSVQSSSHPVTHGSTRSSKSSIGRPKRSPAAVRKRLKQMQTQISSLKRQKSNLEKALKKKNDSIKCLNEEKKILNLDTISSDACDGKFKALFLMEQLQNYVSKKPRWGEEVIRYCLIWHMKAPKSYRFCRAGILKLPSKSTLQRFVGSSEGAVGVTSLIKKRLASEAERLPPEHRIGSLVFDEMSIRPMIKYVKYLDRYVGGVDLGEEEEKGEPDPELANRLLCFVYVGLTMRTRIPVAYFLTKCLRGEDLHKLILTVLTAVEEYNFKVVRLVCDNYTVNVKAFKLLGSGSLTHRIGHPLDCMRPLFLSFDPCHIIKTVRSQYLSSNYKFINDGKEISPHYIRQLYHLQKNEPLKPVRSLTRKHVYPTNIEKMNVKRALDVFSVEVSAALEFMKVHDPTGQFKNVDPTETFHKVFHKWFQVHDVHNMQYHIHKRCPDKAPFFDMDDERLDWLENTFLHYLETWKQSAPAKKNFLSTETYTSLVITTKSTVDCIRYLLECGVHFILTRKFSSDDIEGLFSGMRQISGRNDQANALSVIQGMEKILKIGLLAPSQSANVRTETVVELFPMRNVLFPERPVECPGRSFLLPPSLQNLLSNIENPPDVYGTSMATASAVMVAGYLVRVISDRLDCSSCTQKLSAPRCRNLQTLLIYEQDRGGLIYPETAFIKLICSVVVFLKALFKEVLPVKNVKKHLYRLLNDKFQHHVLGCSDAHNQLVQKLILNAFLNLYLKNIASTVTDRTESQQFIKKPLSRKSLKFT